MIHNVNAREPGDYELDYYGYSDHLQEKLQQLHDEVDTDEHVDGCDCDKCRAMWVDLDDTRSLLKEHNAMKHAVLAEGCPACESYGVEEIRHPNLDWDDTDVPF